MSSNLDITRTCTSGDVHQIRHGLLLALPLDFLEPRSNNLGRKRPVPGNSSDFVEAVFQAEVFWIFPDGFRPVPAGYGEFTVSFMHDPVAGIFDLGRCR